MIVFRVALYLLLLTAVAARERLHALLHSLLSRGATATSRRPERRGAWGARG